MAAETALNEAARWMFGLSAGFHLLFVPLSIGLLLCINLLQTAHVLSGRPALNRAAAFWSRLFLLAWATGMATGYPLRAQLANHWAADLLQAKPVFQAVFQLEGALLWPMAALVLGHTLLRRWLPAVALMVLGWLLLAVMVVQLAALLSVTAWMQLPNTLPLGAHGWQAPALWPLLTHPTTLQKAWHTLSAALLCGAFFVFALSPALMRQGRDRSMARVSVGVAAWVGLIGVLSVMISGHESANGVAQRQPLKFAAFEGHWRAGTEPAPLLLGLLPDESTGTHHEDVSMPYLMSLLRDGSLKPPPSVLDLSGAWGSPYLAPVNAETPSADPLAGNTAQQQGPAWQTRQTRQPQAQALVPAQAAQPPVKTVFYGFRAMFFSGVVCCMLCLLAFWFRKPLREGEMPQLLRTLAWAAPLPWVGTLSGWAVCELGRQPWAVYGHMPTALAGQVNGSSAGVPGLLQMFAAGLLISGLFAWAVRAVFRAGSRPLRVLDLGLARRALQRRAQRAWWALGRRLGAV